MSAAFHAFYAAYLDRRQHGHRREPDAGCHDGRARQRDAAVFGLDRGRIRSPSELRPADGLPDVPRSGRLRCFQPGTGRALRIPLEAIEECEHEDGARELALRFAEIIKPYCGNNQIARRRRELRANRLLLTSAGA